MGVPACLWRCTGEIYKGNREFTELVDVDGYMMRDVGRLFISFFFRVVFASTSLTAEVGGTLFGPLIVCVRHSYDETVSDVRNTVTSHLMQAKRPSSHPVFCDTSLR
jgi:hypothetical protein